MVKDPGGQSDEVPEGTGDVMGGEVSGTSTTREAKSGLRHWWINSPQEKRGGGGINKVWLGTDKDFGEEYSGFG